MKNTNTKTIIGLTGGIGSGKTTVANIFAELGINIVDADIVAREVVAPNSKALKEISQHFGQHFIQQDGSLDRALLRSRIFSSDNDKNWLNGLLHPLIRAELLAQINQTSSLYCLLVAPLLIENNLHQMVSRVLVVDIPEEEQIARVANRDTSSVNEIKRIIASQLSRETRISYADDVIENQSSELSVIKEKVIKLDQKYRTLSQTSPNPA
jgi:dephospho-CoA kinase